MCAGGCPPPGRWSLQTPLLRQQPRWSGPSAAGWAGRVCRPLGPRPFREGARARAASHARLVLGVWGAARARKDARRGREVRRGGLAPGDSTDVGAPGSAEGGRSACAQSGASASTVHGPRGAGGQVPTTPSSDQAINRSTAELPLTVSYDKISLGRLRFWIHMQDAVHALQQFGEAARPRRGPGPQPPPPPAMPGTGPPASRSLVLALESPCQSLGSSLYPGVSGRPVPAAAARRTIRGTGKASVGRSASRFFVPS